MWSDRRREAVPRGVAINVGANTNSPGVRGPIHADGSFEFVPIPETEPTRTCGPTYRDLPIAMDLPEGILDTPVHLDPEFAGYGPCERYTYGDPFGVKARPLLDLEAGDHVFFYATLTYHGEGRPAEWISPGWGAYVIGRFRLDGDPIDGDGFSDLPDGVRSAFSSNAHVRRETFDAAVLLRGDPAESTLLGAAIPLSDPAAGTDANRLVTELSSDSGRGPWWRRPLRFGPEGVAALLDLESAGPDGMIDAVDP